MHTSEHGLGLIESFEGYSATRYDDGTGVLTIGFGTTSSDGPLPTYLSRRQAEDLLRRKLAEKYEPSVNALGLPLSQPQFDALVSFAYNLGPGIFTGSLRAALEARDWRRAASQMLAYDHAGGVRLEGLTRRRHAEAALFLSAAMGPASNPLEVLTKDERGAVNAKILYSKHPLLHRHGLQVINGRIADFRKAIWLAAERGLTPQGQHTPSGWSIRSRRARYSLLWRYSR